MAKFGSGFYPIGDVRGDKFFSFSDFRSDFSPTRGAEGRREEEEVEHDEEAAATGPPVSALLRALRPRSEPAAVAPGAAPVPRPVPGGGVVVVEEVVGGGGGGGGPDHAGGVRVADAGDIAGPDAVRIGHLLHRLHADAVGARAGDVPVRGRDRLEPLGVGAVDPLLRHRPSDAAEGDSVMEAIVNGKSVWRCAGGMNYVPED